MCLEKQTASQISEWRIELGSAILMSINYTGKAYDIAVYSMDINRVVKKKYYSKQLFVQP
jgi:hypothetical protein